MAKTRRSGVGPALISMRSIGIWSALALTILLTIWASGMHTTMHHFLADLRFSLLRAPASGDVIIVSVDQRTLSGLEVAEPTRAQHAEVIDSLFEAGAKRIGLTFQVSTPSAPADDQALAWALRLANDRVILPFYSMKAPSFRYGMMYHEPLEMFSEHAIIGSVKLEVDTDGMVREGRLIEPWHNGVAPSFAAAVAGQPIESQSHFLIDYGINVETIPRVSYIDVLNQNFPEGTFRDKLVFIGSTHAGDESVYSVPISGKLHSVEIHALIADALNQGRKITSLNDAASLSIALTVGLILIIASTVLMPKPTLLLAAAVAISAIAVDLLVLAEFAIAAPIGLPLIAIVLGSAVGLLGRIDSRSESFFKDAFEAREQSQLMRAVVAGNFDGVIVVDDQDRVRLINPTAARVLNWTVEAAIGREREAVMQLSDSNDTDDALRTGTPFETRITRADGNELDVEMSITTTTLEPTATRYERRKGNRTYRIYTFRDISERNQAEAAMKDAATRAMEADRLKSEFIANMSHELRVPLNSIIGFSEVIKQELFGKLGNSHYRDYAKDIFDSGTHLMTIIDDLLEVSKIAAGKVEVEDSVIDMEHMFAECMQIIRGYPNASKKVLSANLRPGCPNLIADKRAIKQILINLLSNAVKFTGDGGGIRLVAAQSVDGGVEIMVSDDGIGIPSEDMHRITEAFHQIDHPSHRRNAGTGLGLHIVQSLAELHGGSIAISSTLNRGTQIRVIFPPERNGPPSNLIHLESEKNTG